MNYVIEDNFDFYSELKGLSESSDISNNICMISHEPLTHNSVTLSCNHSFNYIPLYNELCIHNNKQYVSCPYCRRKADKLIPFIPLPNVTKIYGVNYPTKMCMPSRKCGFILNTGMYKGLACEQGGIEYDHGIFCNKHMKYNLNTKWTLEKEELFKSKSVPELKEMLKSKGMRVGGVKKELVDRWFAK
jgi:hypothetical protein